jgi:type I restriction enzyme M protein
LELGGKLPQWLEKRYSSLWDAYGDASFRLEDAAKVLMDKNKDRSEDVPTYLSELRQNDWLLTESDPKDTRQKLYRLKARLGFMADIIQKDRLTRSDVESLLKRAADLIRTRVDYKFILILLFLKRLSDKWEGEFKRACEEAVQDGLSKEEAEQEAKNSVYHDFDLPEELLWDNIKKDVNRLPENFSKAMKALAELNPELKDIVESVDFVQFASSRENTEILRQLFELFSEKKLKNVSDDILGDAYEWILRFFAPSKAKEGEIYTPREVIKVLVEILDPKPGDTVYDPACGSGGILILSYKYVEEKYGKKEAGKLFLYGQEANRSILALCKMNMYIHGITDYHLEFGDTLLYPKFKEKDGLKTFNMVAANPPWNQDGYDEEVLKKGEFWKERFFDYGFVPRRSADWAWIEHMIASSIKENGRVGVVFDNGSLFRGGKEGIARSKVLKADLVECVILLPEKLFYNTGAPGAIVIFRKNKPQERRNKVLFINASNECEQHPDVRKLNTLGDDNIRRIAEVYKTFSEKNGFSGIVSTNTIHEKGNNLNVTMFVATDEEQEEIDVSKIYADLKELEKQQQESIARLEEYLKEIVQMKGEEKDALQGS